MSLFSIRVNITTKNVQSQNVERNIVQIPMLNGSKSKNILNRGSKKITTDELNSSNEIGSSNEIFNNSSENQNSLLCPALSSNSYSSFLPSSSGLSGASGGSSGGLIPIWSHRLIETSDFPSVNYAHPGSNLLNSFTHPLRDYTYSVHCAVSLPVPSIEYHLDEGVNVLNNSPYRHSDYLNNNNNTGRYNIQYRGWD